MSEVSDRILQLFKEKKIEYKLYEHEPVRTSEEAARVRGVELKTGVKALIFDTGKNYILVLIPADQKVETHYIAKLEDAKKLSMAKPEKVLELAGCVTGSVPPFGHNTRFKTYFYRSILKNEFVNFNIGELTLSVKIKSGDLLQCVEDPIFVD